MAPIVTKYCTHEEFVTQREIDYYEERAKGGVVLLIRGACCVSYPVGLTTSHELGIYDCGQPRYVKELY